MAWMYVNEYTSLCLDYNGQSVAAPMEPASKTQKIAIGSSSAVSEPFLPSTKFVEYCPDVNCSYQFGVNPVATTDDMLQPAFSTQFKGVQQGHQLAVIANP